MIAQDSPDVSLKQVTIEKKSVGVGAARVPAMEIVIDGYSIIPELKAAADILKNLRKSDFFDDCQDIDPGNMVVREGEKGNVCEFTLRVIMKPRIIAPKAIAAGRRP